MMNVLEQLKNLNYHDARILNIEANNIFDDCKLEFEGANETIIQCIFIGCYQVDFKSDLSYDKLRRVKDMKLSQKPYFLQDIKISDLQEKKSLKLCAIDAYPLSLAIVCEKIEVNQIMRG